MNSTDRVTAVVAVLIAVVAVCIICVLSHTTHESHMTEMKYDNEQMQLCIQQPDRTAADCRAAVYGTR